MNYREYELLIQEIFQQLLDQDYVHNIVVEHDVVKQGLKGTHQIDVYWEFKLGDIIYRTIVQAKNWSKPVDQGEVLKFESVLHDLPGQPRGVMVTAKGYQEGALEVAKKCGIKIYEFNEESPPPLEIVYTGWANLKVKGYHKTASGKPFALAVENEIVTPEFSNLIFKVDSTWLQENGGTLPTATEQLRFLPHEYEFYDVEQRYVRNLRDIYSDLAQQIDGRGQSKALENYSFDSPTFMKTPSTSALKVKGFSVEINLKREHQERLWKIGDVPIFILKSLDDGETRRFLKMPGD